MSSKAMHRKSTNKFIKLGQKKLLFDEEEPGIV